MSKKEVKERYQEALQEIEILTNLIEEEYPSTPNAMEMATRLYILEEQKHMHSVEQGNLGYMAGAMGI